jgi:hypothetical protein
MKKSPREVKIKMTGNVGVALEYTETIDLEAAGEIIKFIALRKQKKVIR